MGDTYRRERGRSGGTAEQSHASGSLQPTTRPHAPQGGSCGPSVSRRARSGAPDTPAEAGATCIPGLMAASQPVPALFPGKCTRSRAAPTASTLAGPETEGPGSAGELNPRVDFAVPSVYL